MPIPDIEAVPNPRLREEGSFPLLCSARTRNESLQTDSLIRDLQQSVISQWSADSGWCRLEKEWTTQMKFNGFERIPLCAHPLCRQKQELKNSRSKKTFETSRNRGIYNKIGLWSKFFHQMEPRGGNAAGALQQQWLQSHPSPSLLLELTADIGTTEISFLPLFYFIIYFSANPRSSSARRGSQEGQDAEGRPILITCGTSEPSLHADPHFDPHQNGPNHEPGVTLQKQL